MKVVKHPLSGKHFKHDENVDGTYDMAVLEETQTLEQQIGWGKGTIAKYRLKLYRKGEERSDRRKIGKFHNYLTLLNDMADKIGDDKYTTTVASAYARCNIKIIFENGESK